MPRFLLRVILHRAIREDRWTLYLISATIWTSVPEVSCKTGNENESAAVIIFMLLTLLLLSVRRENLPSSFLLFLLFIHFLSITECLLQRPQGSSSETSLILAIRVLQSGREFVHPKCCRSSQNCVILMRSLKSLQLQLITPGHSQGKQIVNRKYAWIAIKPMHLRKIRELDVIYGIIM